ncbi:IS481 family transposase [Cryobacterium sp. HLT2-28]|uniref:IS481 family transposase n=1 Tax=Cryobacterium sp. HLT2-28 TaxID=1259146 RepID=UPI00106C44FF|nr:IS481 family transposase [Cryobacterium sp. HLT2-28]TFB92585.1 IS481 family transposase [Cryobacterium sp. HLT2-28]
MGHINARLTVHGKVLLIERVTVDNRPVAHVAKELGISRQCAHRWVARYRAQGYSGLLERSSRPGSSPRKTSPEREELVLKSRRDLKSGPLRIAAATGAPARTVSRILARHHVPPLAWCDPLTGQLIRATRATANRYGRERPGELVHIDVKKLGRIPDGGGWRAHGRSEQVRGRGIGFDYVHAVIDDHTRLAYIEIHPDEKGVTAAGVLTRAAAFFADNGIPKIERVLSDNAFAYRNSAAFHQAVADLGAEQRFIKPHCPWTNGKVERLNRTLATEWAYSRVFTSNDERTAALAPWLNYYNTERIHTGIGTTPISRVSPTS